MSENMEKKAEEVASGEAEGTSEKKGRRGPPRNNSKRPASKKTAAPGAADEFEERVVSVNRCAKVVKGGRRFSFSALLVIGDKNGSVGYGLGKAKEVPEAIRKAKMMAQKKMIKVPLDKGTFHHDVACEFGASRIIFKPAADGTGVKAAGACRAILEVVGVRNILTKAVGATNPHNVVKATFKALKSLRSIEEIAQARGRDVKGLRLKN